MPHSDLIPFDFSGAPVRVVQSEDGEPWFVAKDVAELLGYANPHDAIRTHCKGVSETRTPSNGGMQTVKIIPERDVYRLVMRSKLPEAERFEEWVVGEVLPKLRKTGAYSMLPRSYAEALRHLAAEVERKAIAEAERDEAVRTKAEIGSRREATAMATASKAVRRANALEEELGRGTNWKTAKAIPWVLDYFTPSRGMWSSLGRQLSGLSKRAGHEVKKIESEQYGHVNAYHVDVIAKFKQMLDLDSGMMDKYRSKQSAA